MKLKFEINKYYLVGYTISSPNKPFSAWKKLEERIWEKYREKPAYYFLNPKYINLALEKIQLDISNKNIRSVLLKNSADLKKIYQEIFKSKEFKKLFKETKNHLNFVKNQWRKNEKQALKILKEVSGLPLPTQEITIYITHPNSCNGKTIDKNTIVWGHKENWGNYSVVYICHELLHIMIWFGHFQPNYNILHALICLATNNELRIRMNKKGKYFKEKNYLTERQDIIKIEKRILPIWGKYLEDSSFKNILDLKNFLVKNKRGII